MLAEKKSLVGSIPGHRTVFLSWRQELSYLALHVENKLQYWCCCVAGVCCPVFAVAFWGVGVGVLLFIACGDGCLTAKPCTHPIRQEASSVHSCVTLTWYQSIVTIYGPLGYGPSTLALRNPQLRPTFHISWSNPLEWNMSAYPSHRLSKASASLLMHIASVWERSALVASAGTFTGSPSSSTKTCSSIASVSSDAWASVK